MSRRDTGERSGYAGQNYYDQPPLKPSPWDWTVSGYIYLAGMAGAAQTLALVGQQLDRGRYRGMVRNARYLASFNAVAGAVLLIIDLRTPHRWYNMMRIFRTTSPMSFGSYILTAFGGFSGLTAIGELLRGPGPAGRAAEALADIAQFGAAATGAGASTYTASVLSATSTPYWAAAPAHLGLAFGSSSVAVGAAALSLGERSAGRHETARRLDDVAALATAAHFVISRTAESRRRERGIPGDLKASREGAALEGAELVVAGLLPLAAYGINRFAGGRAPALSIIGSLVLIAGGFMLRHGTLKMGKRSAVHPRAQFRFAQPENLPPWERPGRNLRRNDFPGARSGRRRG